MTQVKAELEQEVLGVLGHGECMEGWDGAFDGCDSIAKAKGFEWSEEIKPHCAKTPWEEREW